MCLHLPLLYTVESFFYPKIDVYLMKEHIVRRAVAGNIQIGHLPRHFVFVFCCCCFSHHKYPKLNTKEWRRIQPRALSHN